MSLRNSLLFLSELGVTPDLTDLAIEFQQVRERARIERELRRRKNAECRMQKQFSPGGAVGRLQSGSSPALDSSSGDCTHNPETNLGSVQDPSHTQDSTEAPMPAGHSKRVLESHPDRGASENLTSQALSETQAQPPTVHRSEDSLSVLDLARHSKIESIEEHNRFPGGRWA